MRRLIYLVLAIVLFCGCQKFAETQDLEIKNPSNNPIDNLPEVIYAHMADNKDEESSTRTYVDGDKRVLWQTGDAILYCASNSFKLNTRYVFNGEDGSTSAEFTKDNSVNGFDNYDNTGYPVWSEFSLGVYPYNEDISAKYCEGTNGPYYSIYADYPKDQTYVPNSFGRGANLMIGTGSNNNLYFRNACGYLVIKLYGDYTVKSITLTANNDGVYLAGSAPMCVYSNGEFERDKWYETMKYNSVTLDCSNGGEGVELSGDPNNPTEFWFALPPMTITGGITITVNDGNGEGSVFTKSTTKDIEISRRDIQPMAKLPIHVNQKLYYTRAEGTECLTFNNAFDAEITNHYYDAQKGKFVVVFGSPLTAIKEDAFIGTDITSITIPESVTTIGASAFESCTNLTSITIPESVTTIGVAAFASCQSLTSITIPGNVESIGFNAFRFCNNLESVTIDNNENNNEPLKISYCVYWDPSTSEQRGPFCYTKLNSIVLKRDLKYVDSNGETYTPTSGKQGIFYCGQVVNSVDVTIGKKVTTIHPYMFYYAEFEQITIPASVTTIGNNAFEGCRRLSSVAFERSSTPLTIGFQDLTFDKGPFYDSPLSSINLDREINYVNNGPGGLNAWDEGVFANKHYDVGTLTTTVTLGSNVETISDWMFSGVRMTTITIPSSVTSIGKNAFLDCRILESVYLSHTSSDKIPTLGTGAFDSCDEDPRIYVYNVDAFKAVQGWNSDSLILNVWTPTAN